MPVEQRSLNNEDEEQLVDDDDEASEEKKVNQVKQPYMDSLIQRGPSGNSAKPPQQNADPVIVLPPLIIPGNIIQDIRDPEQDFDLSGMPPDEKNQLLSSNSKWVHLIEWKQCLNEVSVNPSAVVEEGICLQQKKFMNGLNVTKTRRVFLPQ